MVKKIEEMKIRKTKTRIGRTKIKLCSGLMYTLNILCDIMTINHAYIYEGSLDIIKLEDDCVIF